MGRPPDHVLRIEGRPTSGARAPYGTALAGSFEDGTLRVYGPGGDVQRAWKAGEKGFAALAFSGDGGRIAGGGSDGRVSVFESESGRPLGSFAAHKAPVEALALSRSGEVVASGAGPHAAAFRVPGGARLLTLARPAGEVSALAVAPAGDRVAVAFTDVDVVVLDAATERVVSAVSDLDMAAFCLAFSPDGRVLACGCADGVVSLRDAATGSRLRADVRHSEPVAAVAFSPGGARVVSVGISMNPATREVAARTTEVAGGPGVSDALGVLPDVSLGYSADNIAHVVSPGDGGVRVWDVRGTRPESRA